MFRYATSLLATTCLVSACGYETMVRYDPEEGCWREDRPQDVDLSSCERAGPGTDLGLDLYLQDPDGTCWQMPFCSDYVIWIEEDGWSAWDGETCRDEFEGTGRC